MTSLIIPALGRQRQALIDFCLFAGLLVSPLVRNKWLLRALLFCSQRGSRLADVPVTPNTSPLLVEVGIWPVSVLITQWLL